MKKNRAFSLVELSVVILIIGILVAGVTQSGRLIRQIKLSTARSVTTSSDVASIRDIVGWFESSSEGSFENSNSVTDIQDKDVIKSWFDINPQKGKGDKPTLTVGTSNTEPKYYSNGINGIPAVYFDGGDIISFAPTGTDPKFPLIAGDKNYSMFVVFRADGTKNKTKSILTEISGATRAADEVASLGFWGDSSNAGNPGFISNISTKNNNFLVNTTISDSTDYVLGAVVDLPVSGSASSTSVKVFLNSITESSLTTGATYGNISVGGAKFSVGSNTSSDEFFTGLIAEVIIFDRALKKEEYESVMKYLGKKYNVKI